MHTRTGEHQNDPMGFVDNAIKKCKYSIHRLALYYFFIKCEDNPSIDDEFQPLMSEELKGSSTLVAPLTCANTKRKNQINQTNQDAMDGINSIVAVLASKSKTDSQMFEAMEEREDRKAEAKEKRDARKEHLALLKSGVFSSASAKTIKDSILESLGIKKRKINLTNVDEQSYHCSDSDSNSDIK
jgi:hypothetical protein